MQNVCTFRSSLITRRFRTLPQVLLLLPPPPTSQQLGHVVGTDRRKLKGQTSNDTTFMPNFVKTGQVGRFRAAYYLHIHIVLALIRVLSFNTLILLGTI